MGTSSLVFHYRRRLIRFLLYTNFIPDLILKMKLLIPIFAAVVLAEELQETVEVVEAVPAKVESYVQNMRPIVNTWNNAAYRYPAYYNGNMQYAGYNNLNYGYRTPYVHNSYNAYRPVDNIIAKIEDKVVEKEEVKYQQIGDMTNYGKQFYGKPFFGNVEKVESKPIYNYVQRPVQQAVRLVQYVQQNKQDWFNTLMAIMLLKDDDDTESTG